jgi:hypothetical protein
LRPASGHQRDLLACGAVLCDSGLDGHAECRDLDVETRVAVRMHQDGSSNVHADCCLGDVEASHELHVVHVEPSMTGWRIAGSRVLPAR